MAARAVRPRASGTSDEMRNQASAGTSLAMPESQYRATSSRGARRSRATIMDNGASPGDAIQRIDDSDHVAAAVEVDGDQIGKAASLALTGLYALEQRRSGVHDGGE